MGFFRSSSSDDKASDNTPEVLKRPKGGDIETYRAAQANRDGSDAAAVTDKVSAQRQARDAVAALKTVKATDAENKKKP